MRFRLLGFYLLIFILIIGAVGNTFKPEWVYFYRDELILSLIIGFAIFGLITLLRFKIKFELNIIDLFFTIYYIYCFLNTIILNKIALIGNEFISLTLLFIFYVLFKLLLQNALLHKYYYKELIVIFIYLLCLIPVIISLLELLGFIPVNVKGQKICGGLHNQGALSNYLVTLIPFPFTILLLDEKPNKFIKLASILIFILSFILVLITFQRTALLAALGSLVFVSFHYKKFITAFKAKLFSSKIKKYITIGLSAILFLFLGFGLYYIKKDSADGRILMWENCIQNVKEKPFFGSGYNSFIKISVEQQINYFTKSNEFNRKAQLADEVNFAFNDYLQMATEVGITGLILFLILISMLFKRGPENNIFIIGSRACLISFLICSLFSYPMQTIQNYLLFFLFLAIISSLNEPIIIFNLKLNITFLLIILTIVILTENLQIKRFIACKKWQTAFVESNKAESTNAIKIYKDIFPVLRYDPNYLFNYGIVLAQTLDFKESTRMFNKCLLIRPSYSLFLNLGKNYENLNNDSLAEITYLKAANLIPQRYIPKYYLFKIYLRAGQTRKANEIAENINNMEFKIYSNEVGFIKSEIASYLKLKSKY